jgi:LysR family glycine cleavage system transcriptional activator
VGCKLFVRQPRGLAITDSGQQFWAEIAPAITQLTQATQNRLAQRPLRISGFPYLVQTVVLPALAELQALASGRQLSLDTRRDTLALASHGIDLGLRLAPETAPWPAPLRSRRLCGCAGVPIVGGNFPPTSWPPPGDVPSIRLAKESHTWPTWAKVHGWRPRGDGLALDSYAAVLSAAEQGLGVAMGFLPLCLDALESGKLRPLWPLSPVPNGALWAVWPEDLDGPDLTAIVDCLAYKLVVMERRCAEFFSGLNG